MAARADSLDGRQDYLTGSKYEDMELNQAIYFCRVQKANNLNIKNALEVIHPKRFERIIRRSNHRLLDMICFNNHLLSATVSLTPQTQMNYFSFS